MHDTGSQTSSKFWIGEGLQSYRISKSDKILQCLSMLQGVIKPHSYIHSDKVACNLKCFVCFIQAVLHVACCVICLDGAL